jgi:hypothetical protein
MKVAILGASSSKELAPFSDATWQIWTCSPGTVGVPRVSQHFEIHLPGDIAREGPAYDEYLKLIPVFMQEKSPEYPFSIRYPKEEMLAEFGPHFFTSSVSWMLALAISQKADEIGLWGIDMTAGEEYDHQRPGCFRFLEIARDRGIKITLPASCGLLKPSRLYGYE